jgi:hypothetical protein
MTLFSGAAINHKQTILILTIKTASKHCIDVRGNVQMVPPPPPPPINLLTHFSIAACDDWQQQQQQQQQQRHACTHTQL